MSPDPEVRTRSAHAMSGDPLTLFGLSVHEDEAFLVGVEELAQRDVLDGCRGESRPIRIGRYRVEGDRHRCCSWPTTSRRFDGFVVVPQPLVGRSQVSFGLVDQAVIRVEISLCR